MPNVLALLPVAVMNLKEAPANKQTKQPKY